MKIAAVKYTCYRNINYLSNLLTLKTMDDVVKYVGSSKLPHNFL
jgi:hypothetical protein